MNNNCTMQVNACVYPVMGYQMGFFNETIAPVDVTRQVTNFRIYLRNHYYPTKTNEFEHSIYANIPNSTDIDYFTNEYRIKFKKRKKYTLELYNVWVQNIILDICLNYDLLHRICCSDELIEREKDQYRNIYYELNAARNVCHLLPMMYNVLATQGSGQTIALHILL